MPIMLKCDCGRALRVKDEAAGRRIKCPDCESVLSVPHPEDPDVVEDSEVVEEAPPARKPAPPPLPKKAAVVEEKSPSSGKRKSLFDEAEEKSSRPKSKSRYGDAEDDEDEDRPRKPKKKKKKRPVQHEEGASPLRTILGGLASMLIAVVWFVLGLFADKIYIWPPIMFVLGIIAVCRGFWEQQQNS